MNPTQNTALTATIFLLLTSISSCTTETQDTMAEDPPYQEQHRPQFHYSPPGHWMNDPNGMVYYDGEYHLFYQHYPDSNVWGPMHWGHAVSPDLVHWENLPIALYPDSLGYIFSGSAVIDRENTSGFQGESPHPPMVAIYTYHDTAKMEAGRADFQTQAIAYSTDRGRSWTKFEGNPVVANPGIRDFRDPKVFWHADSEAWVMIFARGDRVRLYTSPDLKNWEYASEFGANTGAHGGVWECPDLFELPIEGAEETRWVMLVSINPGGPNGGSATQYFVGDFDGNTFTLDSDYAASLEGRQETGWVDYGRDNYAGVTWAGVPEADGRRIFMGWMSNWQYAELVPTIVWRSAMTLPRHLKLRQTPEGLRLVSKPVRELEQLRRSNYTLQDLEVTDSLALTDSLGFGPRTLEAELVFELPGASQAKVFLEASNGRGQYYRLGYNAASGQYFSDRTNSGKVDFSDKFAAAVHTAPRIMDGDTVRMRVFFDVASVELFADGGVRVITDIFFPEPDFDRLRLVCEDGEVLVREARFFELSSIW